MANHGIRSAISFKGTAAILSEGPRFDEIIEFYRRRGSTTVKHHIVLVKIERAAPLISPVYNLGHSETQVSARWRRYWEKLWYHRMDSETP